MVGYKKIMCCILLTVICVVMSGCQMAEQLFGLQSENQNVEIENMSEFCYIGESQSDTESLQDSWQIDVPEIYQEPELPTGCESAALTMLLLYQGFELEKTTIAETYLIYSDTGDFADGFVGNPWTAEGAGCFPPTLVDTAEIFLESAGSNLNGVNLTGKSLNDLLYYVTNNIPVAVWSTMYMAEPIFYDGEGFDEAGIYYGWYENEHCVVLTGYDLNQGTVTVNDSLVGIVKRSLADFESIYDEIGRYAMVIL